MGLHGLVCIKRSNLGVKILTWAYWIVEAEDLGDSPK